MKDLIKKLVNRVELLVGKALIKAVKDNDEIQLVKISGLAGEVQDDVERLQAYGLTTNPPIDSEAVVVYLNGNRDHGVVIMTDSGQYRLKPLATGEVALYSQHGQVLLLKDDGNIQAIMNTFLVGNGANFVALANQVKAVMDAIETTCTTFTPPGTPDGGAALASAIAGAISGLALDYASSNLKAD